MSRPAKKAGSTVPVKLKHDLQAMVRRQPGQSVRDLIAAAGKPASEVRAALRELVAMRLISVDAEGAYTWGGPSEVVAEPSRTRVAPAKALTRPELAMAEKVAAAIEAVPGQPARVYRARVGVQEWVWHRLQAHLRATGRICTTGKGAATVYHPVLPVGIPAVEPTPVLEVPPIALRLDPVPDVPVVRFEPAPVPEYTTFGIEKPNGRVDLTPAPALEVPPEAGPEMPPASPDSPKPLGLAGFVAEVCFCWGCELQETRGIPCTVHASDEEYYGPDDGGRLPGDPTEHDPGATVAGFEVLADPLSPPCGCQSCAVGWGLNDRADARELVQKMRAADAKRQAEFNEMQSELARLQTQLGVLADRARAPRDLPLIARVAWAVAAGAR